MAEDDKAIVEQMLILGGIEVFKLVLAGIFQLARQAGMTPEEIQTALDDAWIGFSQRTPDKIPDV